ncbi:MAG: class I SAM-dependent methyltransferase [Dysgonamonadaceae bacterium]|jgi:predicted O-methyltransferase YrrM|nr:class I SAM-dependent methyltransferase [Dysgonamonadaceae bacterium]
MKSIKILIKNVLWRSQMLKCLWTLRKGSLSAIVKKAVTATVFHRMTRQEAMLIGHIETIRTAAESDETPVEIVDFGAGDPDSMRTEDEMTNGLQQTVSCAQIANGSKPPIWGLLLYNLVKYFKPNLIVELGTCIGISAAYQATAQKFNDKGVLYTIEGSNNIAAIARKNFAELGLEHVTSCCGKFADVLPGIFETANHRIDYVFIDGHHEEKATIAYFYSFLPHLSAEALLVFDDIAWSQGMKSAWKTIKSDPHVTMAIDMKTIGLCYVKKT